MGGSSSTPLLDACDAGDQAAITSLLSTQPELLVVRGTLERTPLMVAAGSVKADRGRLARSEIVRQLVDAGAPLDDVDEDGWTSLHHACSIGDMEVAQILVRRGADAGARDQFGLSPSDIAESADGGAALTRIGRGLGVGDAPTVLLSRTGGGGGGGAGGGAGEEAAFRMELKQLAEPIEGVHSRICCVGEVSEGDSFDVHYTWGHALTGGHESGERGGGDGGDLESGGGGGGGSGKVVGDFEGKGGEGGVGGDMKREDAGDSVGAVGAVGAGDGDNGGDAGLSKAGAATRLDPATFLQLYYVVDNKPWHLLPRFGAYQYVTETKGTVTFSTEGINMPCSFRILLCHPDGEVVAASNAVTIVPPALQTQDMYV